MKHFLKAALLIAGIQSAFAGPKMSRDLVTKNPQQFVDVIVQFRTPPTKYHLRQLGPFGRLKKEFNRIKAIHLTLPAAAVQALEQLPNVLYITPDRESTGTLDLVTATANAASVWQSYGLDGSGVGVAVIDSGIAAKNDLTTPAASPRASSIARASLRAAMRTTRTAMGRTWPALSARTAGTRPDRPSAERSAALRRT